MPARRSYVVIAAAVALGLWGIWIWHFISEQASQLRVLIGDAHVDARGAVIVSGKVENRFAIGRFQHFTATNQAGESGRGEMPVNRSLLRPGRFEFGVQKRDAVPGSVDFKVAPGDVVALPRGRSRVLAKWSEARLNGEIDECEFLVRFD